MRFYDTAQKGYVDFKPEHKQLGIYVCGITPYDSAHLGHVFTFMIYDLLQRSLQADGYSVKMVRNITDVDEPIYARAAETNQPYQELAKQETKIFQHTMKRLNFLKPAFEPLASEYILQMADAAQEMLKAGYAYHVHNDDRQDIYFDIARLNDFGNLSGFSARLLNGLAVSRGGDPDRPGKRQPLDFLLWKMIDDKSDPAQWQTIVGTGRPGWHIECSIMSSELLGLPFDIHGGGNDLIFPHHEAEIAQGHGLGHNKVARQWLHVAPLLLGGEKMSKSLGNLVFAKDLLEVWSPNVIRLALMNYHYEIGGEWLDCYLQEASRLNKALHVAVYKADTQQADTLIKTIKQQLAANLDTAAVIQLLTDFANQKNAGSITSNTDTQLNKRLKELLGLDFSKSS